MITFTGLKNRTADICGFNATADSQDLTNAIQDINSGLSLIRNQARRYWTRKQAAANLINNQQYYELPPDCTRVTEVYVNSNGLNYPVKQVSSEYLWNKINVIPAITINVPTYYWIRGRNEIGLWPLPSADATNSLNVSYEPQLTLSIDDITAGTCGISNNATTGLPTTVTLDQNLVDPTVVGAWFNIQNRRNEQWYQIATYDASNQFELENAYGGYISASGLDYIIGDCPDIPQEYHPAAVYYAAYHFFLKRKDKATSAFFYEQFIDFVNQYRETYAGKTTGLVQNQSDRYRYSIFLIPPPPITA